MEIPKGALGVTWYEWASLIGTVDKYRLYVPGPCQCLGTTDNSGPGFSS